MAKIDGLQYKNGYLATLELDANAFEKISGDLLDTLDEMTA